MRKRVRRLWMLALLLLGSNLVLAITFGVVAFMQAAQADPRFEARYEQIRQLYYPDSTGPSEADLQQWGEALQPLFEPVDWFRVAVISSCVGFGLVGALAARWRLDPRWLGALPLATLLSGPNPALFPTFLENQGMPGRHLEFGQQVAVLALQMLILWVAAFAFRGSQPTPNGPSPP